MNTKHTTQPNTEAAQAWTKEPWIDDKDFAGRIVGTCAGKLTSFDVALTDGMTRSEQQANSARIVSCVNKLAGHVDLEQVEICPKGTLEALRDAVNRQSFTNANLIAARSILTKADKKAE